MDFAKMTEINRVWRAAKEVVKCGCNFSRRTLCWQDKHSMLAEPINKNTPRCKCACHAED